MTTSKAGLRVLPLPGIPSVQPGDDLAGLLRESAERAGIGLRDGVLVVCQKVVSKAEGRLVSLASVEPSEQAIAIAAEDDKDPRHVEVVLRETARIVRRGLLFGVYVGEERWEAEEVRSVIRGWNARMLISIAAGIAAWNS